MIIIIIIIITPSQAFSMAAVLEPLQFRKFIKRGGFSPSEIGKKKSKV